MDALALSSGKQWHIHACHEQPEALKSLYRSPGNKKKPIGPM